MQPRVNSRRVTAGAAGSVSLAIGMPGAPCGERALVALARVLVEIEDARCAAAAAAFVVLGTPRCDRTRVVVDFVVHACKSSPLARLAPILHGAAP